MCVYQVKVSRGAFENYVDSLFQVSSSEGKMKVFFKMSISVEVLYIFLRFSAISNTQHDVINESFTQLRVNNNSIN